MAALLHHAFGAWRAIAPNAASAYFAVRGFPRARVVNLRSIALSSRKVASLSIGNAPAITTVFVTRVSSRAAHASAY